MREDAQTKGRRYLTEGRLRVLYAREGSFRAFCRGQGAEYRVICEAGRWSCSCPAKTRCAHLVAAQLVYSVEEP